MCVSPHKTFAKYIYFLNILNPAVIGLTLILAISFLRARSFWHGAAEPACSAVGSQMALHFRATSGSLHFSQLHPCFDLRLIHARPNTSTKLFNLITLNLIHSRMPLFYIMFGKHSCKKHQTLLHMIIECFIYIGHCKLVNRMYVMYVINQ